MDKRTSLKINNRTETTFGVASTALSILSLVLFLWVVYQTAYASAGREVVLGLVELIAMLFCLVGLVFGLIGETRRDKFRVTAHVGIVLNLLIGILHVTVLMQAY